MVTFLLEEKKKIATIIFKERILQKSPNVIYNMVSKNMVTFGLSIGKGNAKIFMLLSPSFQQESLKSGGLY